MKRQLIESILILLGEANNVKLAKTLATYSSYKTLESMYERLEQSDDSARAQVRASMKNVMVQYA